MNTQDAVSLLHAAASALRSYQHGNASPELAAEVADAIDDLLMSIPGEAARVKSVCITHDPRRPWIGIRETMDMIMTNLGRQFSKLTIQEIEKIGIACAAQRDSLNAAANPANMTGLFAIALTLILCAAELDRREQSGIQTHTA